MMRRVRYRSDRAGSVAIARAITSTVYSVPVPHGLQEHFISLTHAEIAKIKG